MRIDPSPGSMSLFSLFRKQAPHLYGCGRVSPTEMLKGNREALPRRVQVVLDYLKVKGKASSELWVVCEELPSFPTHMQSPKPW